MSTLFQRDIDSHGFELIAEPLAISLDTLFAHHDVIRCHLLKLDCEGAEYDILYAASRPTLDRIDAIAADYHVGLNDHTPAELTAFLEAAGFLVTATGLVDAEGGYLYARRHPPVARFS